MKERDRGREGGREGERERERERERGREGEGETCLLATQRVGLQTYKVQNTKYRLLQIRRVSYVTYSLQICCNNVYTYYTSRYVVMLIIYKALIANN